MGDGPLACVRDGLRCATHRVLWTTDHLDSMARPTMTDRLREALADALRERGLAYGAWEANADAILAHPAVQAALTTPTGEAERASERVCLHPEGWPEGDNDD